MALQDDIFDIQDALKDKPEAKSFERVMEVFNELEEYHALASNKIRNIRAGAQTIMELIREK